ncbi:multidrug transporter MdtD [Klebsiella michiganensis]|nr:multidrug transporter MdtD [Klebsiella michiganensis]
MATLTLALDGKKGLGLSPLWLTALVAIGAGSMLCYLWHARGNRNALFSLKLFTNRTFSLGLGGSFAGRIGSGMLPFMTPVFLQIGLGFTPFHAGLMMIPMVLGSMGMKRIVVQVVNRFGYRRVLVTSTIGLALVQSAVHGRRPRWLVLAAAGGAVPAGDDQRQPLFFNEYADPERSARRSGQQRQ